MKTSKKILAVILCALMLCSLLAACGGSGGGSAASSTTSGSSSGKSDAKGSEQKTLTYWSFMNEGEPIQKWMQGFIDDYEKETGTKVNVVWCGREVLTKLQARLASPVSDDFPDIVDDSSASLINLQRVAQVFEPIDGYMAEPNTYTGSDKWSDLYLPAAYAVGKLEDGNTYFVPRESYINAFFYNKKIFADLNLSVPTTWEELMHCCEVIKAAGIAPFSCDGNFDRNCAWWFTRLAEHTVGSPNLKAACEGKIKWSSLPGFKTAADCLQEVVDKGYFQDNYQGSVWPASQLLWVQSKTAMIPCGTWLVAEMSESTPEDFEMGIFAWPEIPGEEYPRSEEAWGNYWGILKDGPHKEEAVDFLKFTAQKKYDDAMTEIGSPSAQVNGKPIEQLADQGKILAEGTVASGFFGDLSAYDQYFNNVYNKVITELMLGYIRADECIAKLDSETEAYYG